MADVAALAKVSCITVDRLLNRRGMVGVLTVERVLAAARALNLDRSLTLMPTRTLRVGIVLQNGSNHYYAKLPQTYARAPGQYARFNILISGHYFEKLTAEAVARTLGAAERSSDALIVILFEAPDVVSCSHSPRFIKAMAREGIPVTGHIGLVPNHARWTNFRHARKYADFAALEAGCRPSRSQPSRPSHVTSKLTSIPDRGTRCGWMRKPTRTSCPTSGRAGGESAR